ncbi:DUF6778 family protein [Nioella nitratireducens]|uniref:DUF6778 family protein n=1 Tax=Nioella nitratireducens TaxID=1287720 RepID=UPI0008FD7652|nr:DUF6778 family protein [Nioella nitratireducens]
MNRIALILVGLAAMAVSACSSLPPVDVTQNVTMPSRLAIMAQEADWRVEEINVVVPESLTVSEANSIKPRADIVWREDPLGDRRAQVQAIFDEALGVALAPMSEGTTPISVNLEITRFHALTERTRYTIGGEHEIEFIFTVRNAETGETLTGPMPIDITFRGLGGQHAIEAEAQGIFQRDRIQAQIIGWARQEFGLASQTTDMVF